MPLFVQSDQQQPGLDSGNEKTDHFCLVSISLFDKRLPVPVEVVAGIMLRLLVYVSAAARVPE